MNKQRANKAGQKFTKTIWNDVTGTDFKTTIKHEWKDVYQFYIDDHTREELERMGRFKRWIHITFHLLKGMFYKLTSFRRILLIAAVIFMFYETDDGQSAAPLGIIFLIIILILELKDKLLAQDELAAGRAVQFALMPEHNPTFPGWDIWLFTRSANEVSGDLIDYMQVDSKRLGMTLGDVAGKGLGAALFMAKLQATVRALTPNYQSLAQLAGAVNKIFCRDGLPSRFASMVYLELETDTGRVRLVNAGHFPPIALLGSTLKEMPKGAPALGLIDTSEYTEEEITLNTGDFLLVYSDGLTEARNEKDQFFGDDRLRSVLSQIRNLTAQTAANRILAEVERFVGDAFQSDDLSFVLMKRTGTAQPPLYTNS